MTKKEAIEILKAYKQRLENSCSNQLDEDIKAFDLALKALEDRPQGEWIEESSEIGALGIKYTWIRCNRCGWDNSLIIPKNFCPNCGAKMTKEAEND